MSKNFLLIVIVVTKLTKLAFVMIKNAKKKADDKQIILLSARTSAHGNGEQFSNKKLANATGATASQPNNNSLVRKTKTTETVQLTAAQNDLMRQDNNKKTRVNAVERAEKQKRADFCKTTVALNAVDNELFRQTRPQNCAACVEQKQIVCYNRKRGLKNENESKV